ncbi:MAG: hypothetical protein LAP38_18715 [Acidobacteriia bacterium]|nr:hypothetical protein [Terriglobia bacterium]
MAGSMRRAALGCRTHSGWAALVAIAGPPGSPEVIDRRRIEIADPGIRGSKQPYHAAEPLDFKAAEAFLKRCATSSADLAQRALREAMEDLHGIGYQLASCGLTLASGRTLPELSAVLKSHALIHTAEGEFYRNALAEAGERCGLPVVGVKERDIYDRGAAHLHIAANELERRIADLGKPVGPPWSQDQKYAALAAWLALANYPSER